MFNPKYTLTNEILNMLTAIAEARAVIERARLLPKQELRLRRQALIRMTHSSTHIEGNMLNLRQVEAIYARQKIDAPQRDVYEAENYLNMLRCITRIVEHKRPLTERVVLKIHGLVTDKTMPKEQSGQYRRVPVYVVRRKLGMPQETVYSAPDAKKVPGLIADLLEWIQRGEKEGVNPVIVAGIAHQEIAAIHPFADGNGRTARAIATLTLYQRGYDFRRLFALEDYYNEDRSRYYRAINTGKTYEERSVDSTPWLKYFVGGFKNEIDSVKAKVLSLSFKRASRDLKSQIFLDSDQIRILEFVDQVGKMTVQDVIQILECPKRTAQLHLQRLKKLNMIVQTGKGPSSAYVLEK